MRHRTIVLVGLITLGLALAVDAAPARVTAWPVDALVKVFPGDRAPTQPPPAPELRAARNQHVSLQRVERFLGGFLPALNLHLEEKGWKPIYLQHVLDEPHGNEPAAYARVAALAKRHLPGVPTIDAIDAHDVPEALRDASDVWVPQLGRFDEQVALLAERQRAGNEVWYYTCLFPRGRYMNRLMDLPLLKARLLHWLNYRYSLTGFLHWGWNFWTPEPMKDTQPVINMNLTLLPSGDAFIVYPDRARLSVFPSIRLEAMRAGVEDYEMLVALARRDRAAADALAREAVASFTDYVRDPAAFRRIEAKLIESLAAR